MPLSPGDSLGPYQIVSAIGAGGMGDVYKARDTRLDRTVAIKTSKKEFSERFEREARAVAALNHPNICTLHDLGPDFLVMEFIEGTPLQGPLPLDQALKYALQICDALDAAHKKGITHRDLKPANILVTKSGIKLLDFGLAKFAQPATDTKATTGVTLTMALTGNNEIVGTLYYMSPEQLQSQGTGQELDSRSDIFSFGVVLYEMLTGARAFEGSSPANVIAAIMERPAPSVGEIAPPALDRVLQTCLAKDPDDRWQSVRDLKRELEWIVSNPGGAAGPTPAESRRTWLPWALAGLLAAAIPAAWLLKPKPELPVIQFEIPQPEDVTVETSFGMLALSPDGTTVVYRASGKDRKQMLWVRRLNGATWSALPGTENGIRAFWSPDSRTIGFFAEGKMKRIDAGGGAVQTICDADPAGASWGTDEQIYFQQTGKPLLKVAAAGGTPEPIFPGDTELRDSTEFFLFPDGKHFLYDERAKQPGTHLGSLRDRSMNHWVVKGQVANAQRAAFFANPAGGSWLVYGPGRQLLAAPFELSSTPRIGTPVRITELVTNSNWSLSSSGLLAYASVRNAPRQLSWLNRKGEVLETIGKPGAIFNPRLAPEQSYILYEEDNQIIRWDMATKVPSAISNASVRSYTPVPLPGGQRYLVFQTEPRGLLDRPMNGVGSERILQRGNGVPSGMSKDGRWIIAATLRAGKFAIIALPAAGGEAVPILTDSVQPTGARFSPDGRWIVFSALVRGTRQVFVTAYPKELGGSADNAGTWQISRDGGDQPVWRGDGKEIIYYGANDYLMSVTATSTQNQFQPGPPTPLFPTRLQPSRLAGYDVTADGSRLLIPLMALGRGDEYSIGFIQNWPKLIARKTGDAGPE